MGGKIKFIYSNLEALKQDKRFIEKDLNRCFLSERPKEIKDGLGGKTAKEIIKYSDKADMVLDIHASNSSSSIPESV